MKYLRLFIISLVPFALGGILNGLVTGTPYGASLLWAAALVNVLLWALAANRFKVGKGLAGAAVTALLLNLVPLLVLALLAAQELDGAYWDGLLGVWTQLYYVPTLVFGFSLVAGYTEAVLAGFAACFLLLVAAACLGSALKTEQK